MPIENATIDSTMLGDGRGSFTYLLRLSFGGSGYGAGGFRLDGFDGLAKHLKKLLYTTGVECWEALPGRLVRVNIDGHGQITSIGHIVEDRWCSIDPPEVD